MVEAVRGPVCVLAGAGTGKTTTITRRIANQVGAGAFEPGEVLAVTFTEKAAGELRARLGELGVSGVWARTFHAAALAQLRALAPEPPGELLPSKAVMLRQIANGLPGAYRFRPAGDLAAEVEWAKNRRITPRRYVAELAGHEPPIPADLMQRVYREYEARKAERGLLDFEDLLERAVCLYDRDERAAGRFRARYAAFTVDEFQDVNLLQQALLDRWLGGRDDVCVVGDDYQSIYGFTGATPAYLLEIGDRFPHALTVTLERNYRSSRQVLALANRLAPTLGGSGAAKRLIATCPDGPDPVIRSWLDRDEEARGLVAWLESLAAEGVPLEEIAVLYRTNARSEEYEEILGRAAIPYQVRGGAFLERPAARRLLRALEGEPGTEAAATVERLARADGWAETAPDGLGEQEATRQADLGRLVRLAATFPEGGTCEAFVADLRARFAEDGTGGGVQLLTLHRAKGLEFDAVAIVRLEQHELPIRQAKTRDRVQEERRLLYVGLTRARRYLHLSWHAERKPSRFLAELGVNLSSPPARRKRKSRPKREPPAHVPAPALKALKTWRLNRARADGVPPYVIFHDQTLKEIAARNPQTATELATITGVGPTKLKRYADGVLATLTSTPT